MATVPLVANRIVAVMGIGLYGNDISEKYC